MVNIYNINFQVHVPVIQGEAFIYFLLNQGKEVPGHLTRHPPQGSESLQLSPLSVPPHFPLSCHPQSGSYR